MQPDSRVSQRSASSGYPTLSPTKHGDTFSREFVAAMELRHRREREQDQERIASLEAYVAKIHAEFTKNKQLMQMLINKVETDQRFLDQSKEMQLSSSQHNQSKMDKDVQTDETQLLYTTQEATTEAANGNNSIRGQECVERSPSEEANQL